MKICVSGSGAIGSSIGGVLTEAGLKVYLMDPSREHIGESQSLI
jgi:2-dehydropantoate 2-reductase